MSYEAGSTGRRSALWAEQERETQQEQGNRGGRGGGMGSKEEILAKVEAQGNESALLWLRLLAVTSETLRCAAERCLHAVGVVLLAWGR